MKKRILILIVLCGVISANAVAQSVQRGTVITLSAEATAEVANDEVVINFRVEAHGKQIDAVRSNVNSISAEIVKRLKDEKGVKLKTTNRQVNPIWENGSYQRKRSGWSVVQTGTITSNNLDEVPRWLDAIESAGAKSQGLSFRISDTLRRSTREALRIQAIKIFREKASTVTDALGAKSFYIIRLQTGGSSSAHPVRHEMAYMTKAVASGVAPALSSGDSRLSVSVSGEIEVERRRFLVR